MGERIILNFFKKKGWSMDKALDLWMTVLRDKKTPRDQFRYAAHQISRIIAFCVTEELSMEHAKVDTPITTTTGLVFKQPVMLVPILRSGIAMMLPFLEVFPQASVGIVGLKRDEKTALPHWYYHNLPLFDENTQIIILDPMIATGGTAVATLAYLHEQGAHARNIIFASIVSAPQGIGAIKTAMPEIKIICASYDQELTSNKFIVPGLGDFGDRYFGTE